MYNLREDLASLSHDIWSSWMRWMFDTGRTLDVNVGDEIVEHWVHNCWVMPPALRERWQRQMNTAYIELSEKEKELDREQADKIMAVLKNNGIIMYKAELKGENMTVFDQRGQQVNVVGDEWYGVKFECDYADEFDVQQAFIVRKELYGKFINSVQQYNDYPIEVWFGTNEYIEYDNAHDILKCFRIAVPVSIEFVEEYRRVFGDRWSPEDRVGQTEFFNRIMEKVMIESEPHTEGTF